MEVDAESLKDDDEDAAAADDAEEADGDEEEEENPPPPGTNDLAFELKEKGLALALNLLFGLAVDGEAVALSVLVVVELGLWADWLAAGWAGWVMTGLLLALAPAPALFLIVGVVMGEGPFSLPLEGVWGGDRRGLPSAERPRGDRPGGVGAVSLPVRGDPPGGPEGLPAY